MPAPTPDRNLYVSPVAGHVVSRYGSAIGGKNGRNNQPIGYRRTEEGLEIVEGAVELIPAVEYQRFRREYDRAIEIDKGLVRRDRAAFDAWTAEEEKRREALAAAAERAAKASSGGGAPAGASTP